MVSAFCPLHASSVFPGGGLFVQLSALFWQALFSSFFLIRFCCLRNGFQREHAVGPCTVCAMGCQHRHGVGSFMPVLGVSGSSQELTSWGSPFSIGNTCQQWLTPLSNQPKDSYQVSFSFVTVLLYLTEAFFALPTLLTFGFVSLQRTFLSTMAARSLLFLLLPCRKDWAGSRSPCGAKGSLCIPGTSGGREG